MRLLHMAIADQIRLMPSRLLVAPHVAKLQVRLVLFVLVLGVLINDDPNINLITIYHCIESTFVEAIH